MEITVNNDGKLVIDISDLLQYVDDDQAESIIQAMAWDSRMWKAIKEVVKNEHAAYSWNEDLLKLRIAFLTENVEGDYHTPTERVGEVIAALLTEIDRQRESARSSDRAFWKLYHAVNDLAYENGIKINTPEHKGLHFFHNEAREIAEKYMPEIDTEEEE